MRGDTGHPTEDAKLLAERAVLFHGHLGPFLVIGLRMGLLAKRLLGFKGHFDVRVKAFTGTRPPVSCIVDGLQVSTGATLGKGNIEVADIRRGRPAAEFKAGDRTVEIAVVPSVLERLEALLARSGPEGAAGELAELPDDELLDVVRSTVRSDEGQSDEQSGKGRALT